MGDVGLLKQGWSWLQGQKKASRIGFLADLHWPMFLCGCQKLGGFLLMFLGQWRDCAVRGFRSLVGSGAVVVFIILWSFFLSLTSTSCLVYALLVLGSASATVHYTGPTPGLFIVGLSGILTMWLYGNIWVTGMLFMVGSHFLFLTRARVLIFILAAYCVYSIYSKAGWAGIFLSANLAMLSNDLLICFLQGCEPINEPVQEEEPKKPTAREGAFAENCDFPSPESQPKGVDSPKSFTMPDVENVVKREKNVRPETCSLEEIERIMNSVNHYETLGFQSMIKTVDLSVLKKEYKRKAVLVHPDKNMGNPLASESFKKLQSAYEVLSDETKKIVYDEELRRLDSRDLVHLSRSSSNQDGMEYQSEESRRIECTKCGNFHIWICTSRRKSSARWCQDCSQYHPASDGDGWVELGSASFDSSHRKVEIPRAFVCAESKIFDVSEWAICQGMVCRANTHRPTFHVNTVVGGNPARGFGLGAEMVSDDDEFELWFQQALAAGLFSDAPQRRKSWSPFKLQPKTALLRQLRRFS